MRNYLRVGLRSENKLRASFYEFLYEKHFDWAILLAAFFGTLPYLPSQLYLILVVKIFIFSFIIYFSLRYIQTWKKLQKYYKVYNKAIEQHKSLIDKEKFKELEIKELKQFYDKLLTEVELLRKEYQKDKDSHNFADFVSKHPDKGKSIEDILNKDKSLTNTAIGTTLGIYSILFHIRGIPSNELKNYNRLLFILVLVIIFFIIYTFEVSFLNVVTT